MIRSITILSSPIISILRLAPVLPCWLEASLDIERIVKKRLDPELMTVVQVHYFQPDAPLAARLAQSGCTRNIYYQRLHDAHIVVEHFLLGEAA
jgi:hypothetical protein